MSSETMATGKAKKSDCHVSEAGDAAMLIFFFTASGGRAKPEAWAGTVCMGRLHGP
jgi:hypothetical protein